MNHWQHNLSQTESSSSSDLPLADISHDGFEQYLVSQNYKPSTVYAYCNQVQRVCNSENLTLPELAFKINEIVTLYDVGGEKEHIGNESHRTVINSLRRFKDYMLLSGYNDNISPKFSGSGDADPTSEDAEDSETERLDVSVNSKAFERMAEAAFLSDLLQETWFGHHQIIDILHSTVDAFGYDMVLWSKEITRHVQLKTRRHDSRTATYNLAVNLEQLPSACVIVIEWELVPESNRMELSYRWLGGLPGQPIPSLGDTIAKHTKANAQGVKKERQALRRVPLGRFERIDTMKELVDRLFGEQ